MPDFEAAPCNVLVLIGLLFAAVPVQAVANKVIEVTMAGVVGDGTTLNTRIQKAIDDCAAAGGGTIRFPAGRYLTGTIQIKSNVTLRLEEQATLLGSTDAADYRNLDPFIDGSGNPMGHALIVAVDADHVGIEGKRHCGRPRPEVEGQAKALHDAAVSPALGALHQCHGPRRPSHQPGRVDAELLPGQRRTDRGRDHPHAGDLGLHNNDGINIDSSENVRVRNCDVVSGDDALVIKSTSAKA